MPLQRTEQSYHKTGREKKTVNFLATKSVSFCLISRPELFSFVFFLYFVFRKLEHKKQSQKSFVAFISYL